MHHYFNYGIIITNQIKILMDHLLQYFFTIFLLYVLGGTLVAGLACYWGVQASRPAAAGYCGVKDNELDIAPAPGKLSASTTFKSWLHS